MVPAFNFPLRCSLPLQLFPMILLLCVYQPALLPQLLGFPLIAVSAATQTNRPSLSPFSPSLGSTQHVGLACFAPPTLAGSQTKQTHAYKKAGQAHNANCNVQQLGTSEQSRRQPGAGHRQAPPAKALHPCCTACRGKKVRAGRQREANGQQLPAGRGKSSSIGKCMGGMHGNMCVCVCVWGAHGEGKKEGRRGLTVPSLTATVV